MKTIKQNNKEAQQAITKALLLLGQLRSTKS